MSQDQGGRAKPLLLRGAEGVTSLVSAPSIRFRPQHQARILSSRKLRLLLISLCAMLLLLLVGVPEMLGDRPYDPEPSAWPTVAEHF